jgi:hypothetical protein
MIAPLKGISIRHMHGKINYTIVNSVLLEESLDMVPVIRTMIPRNEKQRVALSIVESLTLWSFHWRRATNIGVVFYTREVITSGKYFIEV